jgi:hypothetical protein
LPDEGAVGLVKFEERVAHCLVAGEHVNSTGGDLWLYKSPVTSPEQAGCPARGQRILTPSSLAAYDVYSFTCQATEELKDEFRRFL